LRDFYQAKLRFPNISSQNDSAEALLQLIENCASDELGSLQMK
jgi:hypothetical protein